MTQHVLKKHIDRTDEDSHSVSRNPQSQEENHSDEDEHSSVPGEQNRKSQLFNKSITKCTRSKGFRGFSEDVIGSKKTTAFSLIFNILYKKS